MTDPTSFKLSPSPQWGRPPGGLLVWFFIVLELATFAMAFGAYLLTRASALMKSHFSIL